MDDELGHNTLLHGFTGAAAAGQKDDNKNNKEDTENEECCNSECGCHDTAVEI